MANRVHVPVEQRFWEKVGPPDPATGCRLWLASTTYAGYGQFRLPTRVVKAHRMAFALHHNVTLTDLERAGIELHHTCPGGSNHGCCEPGHLEPKTPNDHRSLHSLLRARSHREDGRRFKQS